MNGPGPPPPPPTLEPTTCTVASAFTAAALTAGVRLVAFDFDLCVLSIHSYALRLTPAAVLARTTPLAQDFTDLPLFQALVESLLAHGVPVAIASFGRNEVIRTFLGRAFPAVVGGGAGGGGSGDAAGGGGGVTSAAGDGPPDTAGGGAATSASATIDKPALSTCSTVGVSTGLGGGGGDGQQHPLFTICTPQTVGLLDGCSDPVNGKNVQLAYLAQHMGDLGMDSVVFFDGAWW